MRRNVLAICSIAVCFAGCASNAEIPAGDFASRTTLLEDCEDFFDDPANDVIVHRCEGFGGIPIWWRYSDSARLYVGFGEQQHDSGFFGIDHEPEPTIEWRGEETSSGFSPHAAIVRLGQPTVESEALFEPALVVFRLRDDGTSCVVGREIATEQEARQIADEAAGEFECLSEPYVYEAASEDNSP